MGTIATFFASNDWLFVYLFSFKDNFFIMGRTVFFVSYRGILPSIPR
ncbi:hypothetical protein CUZ88_2267 [Enterococcus xinjiangensis]|nr:hypothetical protein [Enterococcus lactis]MBL4992788.1 hypothetical protein [Enterococcus lactis]